MKKLFDLLFTDIGRKITGTILWGILIGLFCIKPYDQVRWLDYVLVGFGIFRMVWFWLPEKVKSTKEVNRIEDILMYITLGSIILYYCW